MWRSEVDFEVGGELTKISQLMEQSDNRRGFLFGDENNFVVGVIKN